MSADGKNSILTENEYVKTYNNLQEECQKGNYRF